MRPMCAMSQQKDKDISAHGYERSSVGESSCFLSHCGRKLKHLRRSQVTKQTRRGPMTAADQKHPSTLNALIRGAQGRCPRCGQGRLLHHYLKIVDRCSTCGEPYGHFRADDAAPWLTILVVGHITVPIILALEQSLQLTMWTELAIYLPLITMLTLVLLPRCKGVILAILWSMKAEGSEEI